MDSALFSTLAVGALGGVLAVDGTSIGQFMVSRPLVAATAAGWVMGSPEAGATLGLILEALHLNVLPVGAARTPEAAPAAVAAAAVYASAAPSAWFLFTAVLFALGWEWVGGETVHRLRQLNVAIAAPADPPLPVSDLARRHLAAAALDFTRGALLTLVGAWILWTTLHFVPEAAGSEWLARFTLGAVITACFGGTLAIFGRNRWPFLAAGVAAGAAWFLVS